MRKINKLTAAKVNALSKPGLHSDGLNLYLQIGPTGAKSWLFRYMLNGKAKAMGFGPAHTVSLSMARSYAQQARLKLLDRIDPRDDRERRMKEIGDAVKVFDLMTGGEQTLNEYKATKRSK